MDLKLWRKQIIQQERLNGGKMVQSRRLYNQALQAGKKKGLNGGGFENIPDTSMFEILRDLTCKEIILTLDQQKQVPSMSSAQWDFLINAIPDEYGFARLTRVDEITAERGQYMLVPHFQGDRNVDVEKANKFYTKCLYVHLNTKYNPSYADFTHVGGTGNDMMHKWYQAMAKITGDIDEYEYDSDDDDDSVGMDVYKFRYFVPVDVIESPLYNNEFADDHEFSMIKDFQYIGLPDTIREIRDSAFARNRRLKRINIPRHVRYIGKRAFIKCSLREINFEGVVLEKIDDHAFDGNNLYSLVLPEGLTHIGQFAFSGNSWLHTVVFPSTLRYIGDWAFAHNYLTDVVLPSGCTIGDDTFYRDERRGALSITYTEN